MPSQGIITSDNVSVDVSAIACFRVTDAVKSVVAIENVNAAVNQIARLDIDSRGFAWLPEVDFVKHFAADVDPGKDFRSLF